MLIPLRWSSISAPDRPDRFDEDIEMLLDTQSDEQVYDHTLYLAEKAMWGIVNVTFAGVIEQITEDWDWA